MSLRRARWLRTNASVIVGALIALGLVLVNEFGYRRANALDATLAAATEGRTQLQSLLRSVTDAETGQRGYLLTGKSDYLNPYREASVAINDALRAMRNRYLHNDEFAADFQNLATAIAKKQEELSLTIALRSGGNDAWQTVMNTDSGRLQMKAIREAVDVMRAKETQLIDRSEKARAQMLMLTRVAMATLVIAALLGFSLYAHQAQTLVREREKQQRQFQRDRDLLETQIQERTRRLSELTLHLLNAREDERARLARELHDELGALLVAAKLDLARLKARLGTADDYVKERLFHLGQALNNGISLKRRIIEELHPSSLSKLGLVAALEILVREFAARTGLPCTCELEPVALTPATELTVYRLVQEALTNIAKYTDASRIEIRLSKQPRRAQVEVRDDGKGFDVTRAAASTRGLEGMRYRVAANGGAMTVHSAIGEGTLITATLPLYGNPSPA